MLGESKDYFGEFAEVLANPVDVVKAMAQNASDTHEIEGASYAGAYIITDSLIGKATSSAISKAAGKGAGAAGDIGKIANKADDVMDAAKITGKVDDAAEIAGITGKADDIADFYDDVYRGCYEEPFNPIEEGVMLDPDDVVDVAEVVDDVPNGNKGSLIDIEAIRLKLKTKPNTAFFWSGKTDGVGGAGTAADIAKSRGGVTLESTLETKNITMPEWDFNNPSVMEAWDLASGAYAEQVSGEIRAVVGESLRPGNIWENVELPRLKNNPNVTKITIIDPKTKVEKVIFER